MEKKILEVEISVILHNRLYKIVPDPAYLWRNKNEPAYRAVERAVESALTQLLDELESRANARAQNDSRGG
jgi:hypothetical protein